MGDLTENFSLSEFQSKDGADMSSRVMSNIRDLVISLQALRDYVGLPITVTSGYRSVSYNRSVGGVRKSQHILGKAADIQVDGYATHEIKNIIEEMIQNGQMEQGGVGLYETFVHYDIRGTKARWKG